MDEFILGLIFTGIMVFSLVPSGMRALKIDTNDIKTNPIVGGCGVGFVVGAVSFFLAIAFFISSNVDFISYVPLVCGVIAGGLFEGKRQREYGRISIMPMVGAAIAGGIGSVIASLLVWTILGGH